MSVLKNLSRAEYMELRAQYKRAVNRGKTKKARRLKRELRETKPQ